MGGANRKPGSLLAGAHDDDVVVTIPPLTLTGLRAQELAP